MSEERGYSAASVALGFILGGVLGGCLALLFAPESGRRTRERLRDLAADVRDKTIDLSEDLRDKAEDAVEKGAPPEEVAKADAEVKTRLAEVTGLIQRLSARKK